MTNNLKAIRELYGATQEQLARAINVNRVTVSNWEKGTATASSSNQEKLSIYYNIGPEYFYDKPLSEDVIDQLKRTSLHAKAIAKKSKGTRIKEDDLHKLFESATFNEAMERYMFSMKMLLATADSAELDSLETALLINKKMGARLQAIIEHLKKENTSSDLSLFALLEKIEKKS